MESSHQARKIIERLLLLLLLGLLGWAGFWQWHSPLIQQLSLHTQEPVQITILTTPAMFVSYNPSIRQAQVRVLTEKKSPKDLSQRVRKLLESENISSPSVKFFEPAQTQREIFWEDFKKSLSGWRYNPLLAMRAFGAYISAWHNRRTNLSPAEFILLATEMTELEPNDFTVSLPQKVTKRKTDVSPTLPPSAADKAPLTIQDRPIIVEVLNASGRKGLALELTQYLREQNDKGLLRVDVLQYDNYFTLQETSWLEDYSGRQVQLKQLGSAIGITGEVRVGNTPNVICDTRIILGKDFKMPL